jgi:hypothetical protein
VPLSHQRQSQHRPGVVLLTGSILPPRGRPCTSRQHALEDTERQIWSGWHCNVLFHIDAIHHARLGAQVQAASSPSPAQEEHSTPLDLVDTSQAVSVPTLVIQPLVRTVTIDNAMPFCVLITSDVEVRLMSLQVFLTLQIPILSLTSTSQV